MPTIYDFHGHTVSRSANLRGIIAHGRKHGVNVITVETGATDYKVTFYFFDRCTATVSFADWRALLTQNILGRSQALVPDRLTVAEAIYDAMRAEGYAEGVKAKGTTLTYKVA